MTALSNRPASASARLCCLQLLLFLAAFFCAWTVFADADAPGAGSDALVISDAPAEIFDDSAPADADIQAQLTELYARIGGLDEIQVEVSSGVVVLQGIVPDVTDRDAAVTLANRLDGVAVVQNRLELDRRLSSRLRAGFERLRRGTLETIAALPSLIAAGLVAAALWIVGGWLAGRGWPFSRLGRNAFLRTLLRRATHAAFAIAGVVAALFIMNAGGLLGSIAGALGIVGLALGFATRDTVENFIASILLSLRQPFAPRDHVTIDDQEGKVMRLSSRATVLMSLDGNHIRIPNSTVFKSTIVNYSRNPRRRFNFDVGVDTDIDLNRAVSLALDTLQKLDGVLDDPAPACVVRELGDSNVVLGVYGWVDQREASFFSVRSNALQSIKTVFDDNDIVMPEPIYNINLRRGAKPQKAATPTAGHDALAESSEPANSTRPDRTLDRQIASDPAIHEDNLLSESGTQE